MKHQSLSSNFIYQVLYQGIMYIIPLIMSPYLTRTLHETALGIFSYTDSIAYYFVLFSMLGIMRHGQRVISQNSEDEKKLRKVFWSLFFIHIVVSVFIIIFYIIFIKLFIRENQFIFFIEILYVVSALFDITWLFYGLENFKNVVVKNAIVKIVGLILIFFLVHAPEDLWKYTVINAGGILIGQMIMIPQAISIVRPIKFNAQDIKQHIKPLLYFFISVVASSLYTVFDKTLLGILSTKESVAFYEYSNKIINIPKTIIAVTGTVMFPRACKMVSKGDNKSQQIYIRYSFYFTTFIAMGAIFGLLAIADTFTTLYYGESFRICGSIIKYMTPLIFIVGAGDIIRTQFMIPNNMDFQYNFCILLNAFINIVISVLLIPLLGVYGAVIGTTAAELFGMTYQMILCRKKICLYDIWHSGMIFGIIGLINFFILSIVNRLFPVSWINLLMELIIGVVLYFLITMLYLYKFQKAMWSQILKIFFNK